MAEERPRVRPSLRALTANWGNSDLPFFGKLRVAVSNNWRKARTRENCCGNLGQPGC